jgi:hypothetical protein
MKHLKMLALAAVAAGALTAFIGAGTASATVLCSTTADPCPTGQKWPVNTPIDFSIPSGGSAVLVDTLGEELDTCTKSTVKGKITNAGSSTATTTGPVEELLWGSCTFPTATVLKGSLEVHKISGTSNGTVTADGTFQITIDPIFVEPCVYQVTAGTPLGELTEGNPAVFHANAVLEKKVYIDDTCSIFMPDTAIWTATYTQTSPSSTTLSVSSS